MTQKKKIPIQIYDCELVFMLTDEISNQYKKLVKKYGLSTEDADGGMAGVYVPGNNMKNYYLLISTGYLTHNTISHEVYHTATQICAERSIEEEESRAWLSGYIAGEIYKFLDRKKQIIKHV